jgi:lysophospholipase L1-like esterase
VGRWLLTLGGGLLARRLLVAACAGLLVLLGGEGALRLAGIGPFQEWSPRGLHRADPQAGIAPTPGFHGTQATDEFSVTLRIDADGLRETPTRRPPAPDAASILILGDSFAFGHGVEDDQTIAARLAEHLGPAVRVRNGGVMSYGTLQELARFEALAPRLAPRLCVLLFYAGNDVLDNARPALTVRSGWTMAAEQELTWLRRVKLGLKYRSALYRVVAERFFPARTEGLCADHTSLGFDVFRTRPPERVERAWLLTEDSLARFVERTAAAGCQLVVAVLPARFQVEPAWWQELSQRCGFVPGEIDLELAQRRVVATCTRLGVPVLDLLPAFREAPESLYYHGLLEMHLEPAGHALAATLLADFLLSRELVP